jgi:hypothetical protein
MSDSGPSDPSVQSDTTIQSIVLQPIFNGIAIAGVLLAVVSIFASWPEHWVATSLVWEMVLVSILIGLVFTLSHTAVLLRKRIGEVESLYMKVARQRDRLAASAGLTLPKVVRVQPAKNNSTLLLLIEPSPFFAVGQAASVYVNEGGFEILVCEGRVETVQQSSRTIQLLVTDLPEDEGTNAQQERLKKMMDNDHMFLNETFIRPGNQAR